MSHDDTRDEEAALTTEQPEPIRRYHDDSDESDSLGPDAPLHPGTPSADIGFDGLNGRSKSSLQNSISERIPPGLRRAWESTKTWAKGPQPPRIYQITPIFPKVQHAPLALLDRYAPRKIHRFWLLLLVYFAWLLTFSLVLWRSSFAAHIPGYGAPTRLSCSAKYWSDGNGCGINGDQCRPFSNATLAFRCPADCHKIQQLNPHAVGDKEVVYKPLVVGGPVD